MANLESLCVVRIHNNEEIQPAVKSSELLQDLCNKNGITFIQLEVSKQSEFIPANSLQNPRLTLIRRRDFQRKVELMWFRFIGRRSPQRAQFQSLVGQLLFIIRLSLSRSLFHDEIRKMQIERFLTIKHISAIKLAIETDADLIVVLESDATVHDKSDISLSAILDMIQKSPEADIYINVASGIDRKRIGINHLQVLDSDFNYLDEFRLPVTNTNCAYLLTNSVGVDFASYVDRNQSVLELGADWVINDFFMSTNKQISCFHSEPPALIHGSFEGVTQSWSPRDRT